MEEKTKLDLALDECKAGGDPLKAQAYALIAIGIHTAGITEALFSERNGINVLDQIATALRGIEMHLGAMRDK
jgi:hypothetical protein